MRKFRYMMETIKLDKNGSRTTVDIFDDFDSAWNCVPVKGQEFHRINFRKGYAKFVYPMMVVTISKIKAPKL